MPNTRSLRRLSTGLSISAALVLGACSSMPESSSSSSSSSSSTKAATPAAYQPVTDVPIPAGSKINTEKSLILGQGDKWVGRMFLVMDRSSTQAYTYYEEQMPKFGWEPVSAVQGKTSIMTFTRGENRAATLEIVSSTFSGSEVSITVSPRNAGGTGAAVPATTPEKK